MKLESPVAYSDKVKPICLPDSKIYEIGDSLTVTGWVIKKLFIFLIFIHKKLMNSNFKIN